MAKNRQKLNERITDWVTLYAQRQSRLCLWGGVSSAVGAMPVLFITFWVIYAAIYVGFSGLIAGHGARLIASGLVLILIFVGYITANWEHLQSLKFESMDRLQMARLVAYATGQSGFSLLAGPETMHTAVKVISMTLLAGPGLIDRGLRLIGRSRLLRELDVAAVTLALIGLLEAEQRVPVEELSSAAGIDDERLSQNLSLVDGVVPLRTGDLAYTLTDDLRQELIAHRPSRASESNEPLT